MSIKSADAIGKSQPPSAADAIIRAEELHKYYEMGETRVHALRGEPDDGREFVAIMGASGGKSTPANIRDVSIAQLRAIGEGGCFGMTKGFASIRNQKMVSSFAIQPASAHDRP
jgi:hypothetical protein